MTLRARAILSLVLLAAPLATAQVAYDWQRISNGNGFFGALPDGAQFGAAVTWLSDIDGNGARDLAVGSVEVATEDERAGAVWILMMQRSGAIRRFVRISNAAGGLMQGVQPGDEFGASIASLGDLDGDGVEDIAAGARNADGYGAVLILFLQADGRVRAWHKIGVETDVALLGGHPLIATGFFGDSLANLGDLDGDGRIELAVGASREWGLDRRGGAVRILSLNSDGTPHKGVWLNAHTPGLAGQFSGTRRFGAAVFNAPDLPGTPLIVGAPGDHPSLSRAWSLTLDAAAQVSDAALIEPGVGGLSPSAPEVQFGDSGAWLGDLNGDGIGEWLLGTPQGGDAGGLWIVYPDAEGTVRAVQPMDNTTGDFPDLEPGERFGVSVAVKYSGNPALGDIVVGAPGRDDGGPNRGAIWLAKLRCLRGETQPCQPDCDADGISDPNEIALGTETDCNNNAVPDSCETAGGGADCNANGVPDECDIENGTEVDLFPTGGDGIPDSCQTDCNANNIPDANELPDADCNGNGILDACDLLTGTSTDADGDGTPDECFVRLRTRIDGHSVTGLQFEDGFGDAITVLGDLDGDGIRDLAIAAPTRLPDETPARPGKVWIAFMDPSGAVRNTVPIDQNTPGLEARPAGDLFGECIAPLGDLNGDGIPDMAAGAPASHDGVGSVWILLMNRDGSVQQAREITQDTADFQGALVDGFGNGLAHWGDIDRDGKPELIVGETRTSVGDGKIWILSLNPDGTVGDHRQMNPANFDQPTTDFGSEVAVIGDLDRDGVPEIVVQSNNEARGRNWLCHFDPDMSLRSLRELDRPDDTNVPDARFGNAITPLGDLDGDGVPDLALGATHYRSFTRTTAGEVWLAMMNADGSVRRWYGLTPGEFGFVDPPRDFSLFGSGLAVQDTPTGKRLMVGAIRGDYFVDDAGVVFLFDLVFPPCPAAPNCVPAAWSECDCNRNGVSDLCELEEGDCDADFILDDCERGGLLAGYGIDARDSLLWAEPDPSQTIRGDEGVTIEAVVRIQRDPSFGTRTILAKGTNTRQNYYMKVFSEYLRFGYHGSNQFRYDFISDEPVVPYNRWVAIAATHDFQSSVATLYVDGQPVPGTWNVVPDIGPSNPINQQLTIGAERVGTSIAFWALAELDEIRLFRTVRTAEEIAANTARRISTLTPGLVSYWRLDAGRGDVARDLVGPNHLQRHESVRWIPLAACDCIGDNNDDGRTDLQDLARILVSFGEVGIGQLGDSNLDGVVDLEDLGIVLGQFGCGAP